MVKANELRIGNMLYSNLTERNFACSSEEIYNLSMDYNEENANYIELTEKSFLKAGFIHKNGYGRIHSKLKGNIFISECGSYYVYQYYDIRIELKYVHQLQNLYFALCGEELVFSSTEP